MLGGCIRLDPLVRVEGTIAAIDSVGDDSSGRLVDSGHSI